jgi:hypothetical protein
VPLAEDVALGQRIRPGFEVTTAASQKFRKTTIRGRGRRSAAATRNTAKILEMSRAVMGPICIRRARKMPLSPAPIPRPVPW